MIKCLKILLILPFLLLFSNGLTIENKIILKIDNEIVTTIDIFDKIKSLKFFNKKLNQLNDEEIYNLAIQSITKHKIKKKEIQKIYKNLDIQNKDYLNELVENNFKRLGFLNKEEFKSELKNKEISFENFKEKLEVEILWNQLIYSKNYKNLYVDEEKLKKQIDNLNKTINSFNLREIVFEVLDKEEIDIKYNLIKEDIKKLGFEGAALKNSKSDTSVNGGNLGWVNENLISSKILEELKKISLKEITKPIRISNNFVILQKFDERKIKKEINADLELKRLVEYEKNRQLNNYSDLYFNKIKKNVKINAP